MVKCKYGKLKSPVRERGRIRRCKLKPKTKSGRKQDRKRRSREFHEVRYAKSRRKKRRGKR